MELDTAGADAEYQTLDTDSLQPKANPLGVLFETQVHGLDGGCGSVPEVHVGSLHRVGSRPGRVGP